MSQRHDEALRAVLREHDDVVWTLREASQIMRRGAPGRPNFDSERLQTAIVTAGDAYALLLIATAEGFLREYLLGIGIDIGREPKLRRLIEQSYRELNRSSTGATLHPQARGEMYDLCANRNSYAHGRGRNVFPTVARVQVILSKYLHRFP